MLKQRIITVIAALAVVVATLGISGVVGDAAGLSVTPPAHACSPQGSGGGC